MGQKFVQRRSRTVPVRDVSHQTSLTDNKQTTQQPKRDHPREKFGSKKLEFLEVEEMKRKIFLFNETLFFV